MKQDSSTQSSDRTGDDDEGHDELRWRLSDWVGRKLFTALSWLERTSPDRNFRRFDSLESVFANAFHYRFYVYSPVLVTIFLMMIIDHVLTCSVKGGNAGFYASTFNLIGTLIFARGLIRGSLGLIRGGRKTNHTEEYEILKEFEGFDWNRLVSLTYSSIDAVWAVVFILFGYLLNIMVAYSIFIPAPCLG